MFCNGKLPCTFCNFCCNNLTNINVYPWDTNFFLQPTGIGHIFFSMQNLWDMQIFKMNKIKRDCEKCHYI